ncbi:MAG: hypothetical protein ACFFBC_00475 [Promethearchaeota archaeon]
MSTRREKEQMYSAFYTSLKNILYNSAGYNIEGVARWGSRTTGDYRGDSDLDVIFWIIGKPIKQKVYENLIQKQQVSSAIAISLLRRKMNKE